MKEYRRRIRQCEPVGAVNDRVATLNFLYCHEDAKQAAAAGMRMVGMFGLANSHLLWTREAFPTRAYQSLANLAPSGTGGGNPADPYGVPDGICVGEPKRIAEAIRRWESIGIDGINFILNGMETIPQADVLASLRLFAREVMPHFQKRDVPARASARSEPQASGVTRRDRA